MCIRWNISTVLECSRTLQRNGWRLVFHVQCHWWLLTINIVTCHLMTVLFFGARKQDAASKIAQTFHSRCKMLPGKSTFTVHCIHNQSDTIPPKVVLLTGTTGVGKSFLASKLAQLVDGELISADSVKVLLVFTVLNFSFTKTWIYFQTKLPFCTTQMSTIFLYTW